MIKILNAYNLPVIRMLKIGAKAEKATRTKGGKTFQRPVKLDAFRLVYPERDKSGNYIIDDSIPASKEVAITFPFSTPDDVFASWLGIFDPSAGIYVCRGNGEEAKRINRDTMEFETVKCTCKYISDKCKPRGVLYFQIPEVNDALSVTVFKTTSWNTIRNIQIVLSLMYSITEDLRRITDAKLVVENRLVWHNGMEVMQPIVRITSEEVLKYLDDRKLTLNGALQKMDSLAIDELVETFDDESDAEPITFEQAKSAEEVAERRTQETKPKGKITEEDAVKPPVKPAKKHEKIETIKIEKTDTPKEETLSEEEIVSIVNAPAEEETVFEKEIVEPVVEVKENITKEEIEDEVDSLDSLF